MTNPDMHSDETYVIGAFNAWAQSYSTPSSTANLFQLAISRIPVEDYIRQLEQK
jgi:hypothetical protein